MSSAVTASALNNGDNPSAAIAGAFLIIDADPLDNGGTATIAGDTVITVDATATGIGGFETTATAMAAIAAA